MASRLNSFFSDKGDSASSGMGKSADMSGQQISDPLDIMFYREIYADLESLDDSQILEHWKVQGQAEGRFANPDHALASLLSNESVPRDFDAEEYLFLNEDLRNTLDWSFQAVHHYLQFGIEENRRYKVSIEDAANQEHINAASKISLDLSFYREFYPDLAAFNDAELAEHWQIQGQVESRFGNADHALEVLRSNEALPDDFKIDEYLRLNDDLGASLGWPFEAVQHYLEVGIQEGRKYKIPDEEAAHNKLISLASSISLDIPFYKETYPDLASFNDVNCLEHWKTQGYAEGRFANPDYALEKVLADNELPEDFDEFEYLRLNEDLHSTLDWPYQAVLHYVDFGSDENRRYVVCAEDAEMEARIEAAKKIEFNKIFYVEYYPDLANMSDSDVEHHWLTQGHIEGRFGSPEHALQLALENKELPTDFDIDQYLFLNKDVELDINWPFQAVQHYLQSGRVEGRQYLVESDVLTPGSTASLESLDISFYRDAYPDLQTLNDTELLKHWHLQGQIEGRFGNPEHALRESLKAEDLPADFNADEYLSLNADLGTSIKWPYQAVYHYLNFGKTEKRRYCDADVAAINLEPVDFDEDFYRGFYPDNKALSDEQCLDHWRSTGVYEGRSANIEHYLQTHHNGADLSEQFNVPTYIRKNSDLIGYFDNKWAYYRHYLLTGREERRGCIPDVAEEPFIEQYYGLDVENIKTALDEIRVHCAYERFTPVFLNEFELTNYHGFKHTAFLKIFDHEAYMYANGAKTEQLAGTSRARCLEHFLQIGCKEGLQISYDHFFDATFYGQEYRTELLHLVRYEDRESTDIWAMPDVSNRIYEHWVKQGIHEGKFANISKLVRATNGVDLPTQVEKEIEYFSVIHKGLITDSRPSQVFMSFISHGIERNIFKVTHSVETCVFYCHIGKEFTRQGKSEVAIRLYEELLHKVPDYALALHELGDELIRAKFYGRASECYQALVDSGTATEWVYLNLSESYVNLSDFSAAARTLKRACEEFPADTVIGERAKALVETNFHRALEHSKHYVQMDRVPEGRQEILNALSNFEVQRVDERVLRNTGRIAVIGNHDLAQCRFYRIDQKIELLHFADYKVDLYKHSEPLTSFYSQLHQYEAVIFYRVPSVPEMIRAINATNVEGIPSIYDVDDLVFDEKYFPPPLSTYAGQISKEVHGSLTVDLPLMEHAISMCEYGLASTSSLATHMAKFVRSGQVEILRNGLSTAHLRNVAQHEADNISKSQSPITIFYGSGTRAHKNDFHDIVEPALVKLHEKYGDKIRFLIMGHITMTESLESLGDTLELLEPVSDIEVYWDIMRSEADINLAVLSSTEVTDTKSEIKWLEAAMFGIPSVVSSTASYKEVVEHGETGYIGTDSNDFFASIDLLINDEALRERVGQKAKDTVLSRYGIEKQSAQLVNGINAFKSNAVSGKKKIAIVNVFYPPEAIGGATRVVHDNVLELKSLYGDELDIQVFCTSSGTDSYVTRQYEQDGIKVSAVTCPSIPNIDHNMSDKDMGLAFKRFLDRFEPDLVHFHCIQRLTESIVTETRRLGIPYFITAHDGWWISDRQFLIDNNDKISLYSYENDLVKAAQAGPVRQRKLHKELKGAENILAVSEPFRKIYESTGLDNVITIENGVSGLNRVRKTKSTSGKVRLAHIGGTERHKGLHLLKNVLMSSPEITNIELLVIDHGGEYGTIRKEMWGSTEVMFKAKTPQAKVAKLYSEIDVLIAPSVWPESYGLVTREALFCGCWVIASDRGAIGESVDHGSNGFVVSVDDLDGLRETVATIDANPERYLKPPEFDLKLRSSSSQAKELYKLYNEITEPANIRPSNKGKG